MIEKTIKHIISLILLSMAQYYVYNFYKTLFAVFLSVEAKIFLSRTLRELLFDREFLSPANLQNC